MKDAQIAELLLQALETEIGGTQIYMTAIKCATNEDLKEEFNEYLDQTQRHVEVVEALLTELGVDPTATSPGREVAHHIGSSLVVAMDTALAKGTPPGPSRLAGRCPRVSQAAHSKVMSYDFGAIAAVETAGTAAALPALNGTPPARNGRRCGGTFKRDPWTS